MLQDVWPELLALVQVVMIDLVLAGDNAVIVGMAAAGVAADRRAKVVFLGVGAAVVMRVILALLATQLLGIIGLKLAGGILLLGVAWRMWAELRHKPTTDTDGATLTSSIAPKSFLAALTEILIADLSMSLDNVLAVAGAAHDHLVVLVIGLLLSVALMGAVASFIADKMAQNKWISWFGLLVIIYVAMVMILHGTSEVSCAGLSEFVCEALPGAH